MDRRHATARESDDQGRSEQGSGPARGAEAPAALGASAWDELAEMEQRWAALLDFSPHPVMVVRVPDGTVLLANPEAQRSFGASQDPVGRRLASLLGIESAPSLQARLEAVDESGEAEVVLKQAAWPGRGSVPVELRLASVRWHGEPAVLAKVRDLSDRMTVEYQAEQLLAVEQKFRQAFEGAAIGMALVAVGPVPAAGAFLEVNEALCTLLGRDADDLVACTFAEVSHPDDAGMGYEVLRSVSEGELARGVVEQRYLRPDGRVVWARVTTSAVRGSDGQVRHLVSQAEDITARKDAEAQLAHQALHDSLTSLPNRAHLMEHLQSAIARATRTARVVGVLHLDIDDFKDVNDSLGHTAGDAVLVEIARRVTDLLRDGDVAARLGGDELVVVCDDLTDPSEIQVLAQRVVDAVTRPIEAAGHVLHLTASVGVATGGVGATPVRLVRDADAAMYRAKRSGKARYEMGDDSLAALAIRQIEIYDGLHRALERHELRLVYQPILDLSEDRVTGVEALLRWDHPERGVVGPAEFIDVAESRELIVPIGRWVLHEAVRQATLWFSEFGADAPRMWVNISDRQVGRHDLAGLVRGALDDTGLPVELLGLELTERQVVRTGHSVRSDLAAIRGLGVGLAIDDFGTGRTGIDYLRELPVSHLKIDRTFVSGLGQDRTNTALTDAIITLGRGLGLTVTAEGVETSDQLGRLRQAGCHRVQGYLLGRPQPPSAVAATFGAGFGAPTGAGPEQEQPPGP
ncbi:EAL domain-containing protein [Isoptericola sp. b441]|uniref:EAL domain-containing protein n=1 Tax=Actinotalea lenta TaxID=3064654 RepID=A0ABT9DCT7_9CELL|nr:MULTISPECIES: EAL domain-containing protein [unclassified Isoptericola]MDO8108415.1 EAL domain-containing protein [Isoptericola sp. b441]MDO8119833.1 EAL domain-containing protein [Isoptericola sp. b490]